MIKIVNRQQRGDLVTDAHNLLSLSRKNFSCLIKYSEGKIPGNGKPESSITDDWIDALLFEFDKVRKAIDH